MNSSSNYECIIIGAGAAGLMCAATAGFREKKVLVLEKTNKVGKKILMSGGGRCNFTNLDVKPENFISNNPHFCKSALSRYNQYDFINLVDSYGLEYHEKEKGQLFCDHRSKDILDILLQECEKAHVEIKTKVEVENIQKAEELFILKTSEGHFKSESVVIATGGLSIPTLGSSGFGYDIAKQFGIKMIPTDASLAPFIFNDDLLSKTKNLAGISLDAMITCDKTVFHDPILFTHKGISGPGILQISNYWKSGNTIKINFLPKKDLFFDLKKYRDEGVKLELRNKLSQFFPKKFVEVWLESFNISKPVCEYSDKDLRLISDLFQNWSCIPKDTEGYKTAEVTRGGVDTDEISSKTFESKKVSGLYFIGEVLDVTGWLGGYNFQWAWSSGWCAGQYV